MSDEKNSWQEKDTSKLDEELAGSAGLTDFLRKNHELFVDHQVDEELTRLLKEKNIQKSELAKRSGMSDVYLYQVLSRRRTPSRDRLLCLCIGMGCTLDETQEVLKRCRYVPLYSKIRRDAAIMYALMNGWNIDQLNDNLFQIEEETMF